MSAMAVTSENTSVGFPHWSGLTLPACQQNFVRAVEEGREVADRRAGRTPATDHGAWDQLDPSTWPTLEDDAEADLVSDGACSIYVGCGPQSPLRDCFAGQHEGQTYCKSILVDQSLPWCGLCIRSLKIRRNFAHATRDQLGPAMISLLNIQPSVLHSAPATSWTSPPCPHGGCFEAGMLHGAAAMVPALVRLLLLMRWCEHKP